LKMNIFSKNEYLRTILFIKKIDYIYIYNIDKVNFLSY